MFPRTTSTDTPKKKDTKPEWPKWTPTENPKWQYWPLELAKKSMGYDTAFICEDRSIIRSGRHGNGGHDYEWFNPITGQGYCIDGWANFKDYFTRATLRTVIGNKLLLQFNDGLYTLEKPTETHPFRSKLITGSKDPFRGWIVPLRPNLHLCIHNENRTYPHGTPGKNEIRLLDIEKGTSTLCLSHLQVIAKLKEQSNKAYIQAIALNQGNLCMIVNDQSVMYFQIWRDISHPLASTLSWECIHSQTIELFIKPVLLDHDRYTTQQHGIFLFTLLPDRSYVVGLQDKINHEFTISWLQKLNPDGTINGEPLFQTHNMQRMCHLPNSHIFIRSVKEADDKGNNLRIEFIDIKGNSLLLLQTFSAVDFLLTANNSLMVISQEGQKFYHIHYRPEKVSFAELSATFNGLFSTPAPSMPLPLINIMSQFDTGIDLWEISIEEGLGIEPEPDLPKNIFANPR